MNEKPGMFETLGKAIAFLLIWLMIIALSLLGMGWIAAHGESIDKFLTP